MLIKLIKYELKATGRIMLPLYVLLIVSTAALGTNLSLGTGDGPQGIFTIIFVLLFGVCVAAVFIATVLLVLMRFYRNLMGEEGYLMFSLPVTTGQHIISKVVCPLLWSICSLIVGLLCGFIMERLLGGTDDFYEQIRLLWNMLMGSYGTARGIRMLVLLAVTGILSILESVMEVYAAISVGHLWTNHRVIGSVLAYIAFGLAEVGITRLLHLEKLLERLERSAVVTQNGGMEVSISWLSAIEPNCLWMIGLTAVQMIIYGAITWYVLDKRLNLA